MWPKEAFPVGLNSKEFTFYLFRRPRSLGWEDPLEKRNGYPLQYSCLDNPMDRVAWWATVPGVAKELDMTQNNTMSTDFGPRKLPPQ